MNTNIFTTIPPEIYSLIMYFSDEPTKLNMSEVCNYCYAADQQYRELRVVGRKPIGKEKLTNIQYKLADDTFGWTVKV